MKATSKIILTAVVLAGFYFVAVCFAQEKQRATQVLPSIKKLMSHEEFSKAGLSKLSDEEIKALDAWLQKHTLKFAQAVAAQGQGKVIETQIEGEFEGWDGDTIWKMTNGQIWKQAAYAYHYHYAYRPKVLIYQSGVTHKMKVDGVSQEVTVERVK